MGEATGRCWFCVHTRRGMERIAALNLGRQGFATFFPQHRKTIRHARKESDRDAPLFNGYIFVRFDPVADRWQLANSTAGVKSLVMQGPTPVPVPPGVVDELRARCDAQSSMKSGNDAGAGDDGRVDERAAIDAGHAGLLKGVVELDDQDRLEVLFGILHSPQPQRLAGGVR